MLFSGCKVTTKYSFLQVLRVKTCKKNAHFCRFCAQIKWFEQIKHLICLEI